jgi:hypothetical protein
MNREQEHEPLPPDGEFAGDPDDARLLERILQETISTEQAGALELIRGVARQSQYTDTTDIGAVEEVVSAIIARRFGTRVPLPQLVRRVGSALIEQPEATIRLERIWQEARNR